MIDFDNFHCLGETSVDDFLSQYWQKKPLLIRQAFPGLTSPLSAEELAGLACEEQVNARLVLEKDGSKPWQLEFGPFAENRFSDLPESHWSLLVSDVEKHCPETKSLLKPFHFIPDWRIDDLMISYAPTGGSVGAHTDAYDVFLIQLSGQRQWQIAEHYDEETLCDTDLCILKDFKAEQQWLLNAGDMLYLPPNVAHHGIAQDFTNQQGETEHCLTASVGFRAPSINTVAGDFVHFLNESRASDSRYRDRSPSEPVHHAEISEDTVTHFIDDLKQALDFDREQVRHWLGQYCSDNKAFEDIEHAHQLDEHGLIDSAELEALATETGLRQSPYSRFLFSSTSDTSLLFVDGNSYQVSKNFAETLCADDILEFAQLDKIMNDQDRAVLLQLYNSAAIIPQTDEN